MNKELYKFKIGKKIIDFGVNKEALVLTIEDGSVIEINYYHSNDCCESVYADFDILSYYKNLIIGKIIEDVTIKGVSDMGFLLCFDDNKIFVPCYNYQNGYYSSNLTLNIKIGDSNTAVDISDFVEDHID